MPWMRKTEIGNLIPLRNKPKISEVKCEMKKLFIYDVDDDDAGDT